MRMPTVREAGPRRRGWLVAAAVAVLLGQMAVAMVTAARAQSATTDEPVYIGAAAVYLHRHRLRYNIEHPPLAKEIIAAGLAFGHTAVSDPLPATEWRNGTEVLYRQGANADEILWLARLPMIVLTLLFGLVVFGFARDLAGPAGGLLALAVYTLTPDVIANGSLAGVDLPCAGFLLATLWMLWRARVRPGRYLPLAGVLAGAALSAKMTALAAMPIVAALAAWPAWSSGPGRSRPLRALAAAAGVVTLAVLTVWATYLAVDPHLRYGTDGPVPPAGGLSGLIVGALPLPAAYRDGLRIQLGFEHVTFGGFLLGHDYRGGRWYYLPVALLIKEPLGAMALWAAGAVVMLRRRASRAAAWYLTVPALVLLGSALTESRDVGVRYALVVPIFLAVAAGCAVAVRRPSARLVAAGLALFVAVSSWRTFPYYLPYSNEAWGGPAVTSQRLSDSNSDWGQDLKRTATWLHRHRPGQAVYLDYHGGGSPAYYGIRVTARVTRGLLVISDSRIDDNRRAMRRLLRGAHRITQIGHSISIYQRH
jgi:hypothetical protein